MITLDCGGFRTGARVLLPGLRRVAKELGLRGGITIRLAGAEESRRLNRQFRHKDTATDVLSFPMNDQTPAGRYVGDILICVEVARRQALERNHSLTKELWALMVHGLLHLGGYDHETDQGEMALREQELGARHGGVR